MRPRRLRFISFFFFFNDTATTEISTLSLHDALPISCDGLREDDVPPSPKSHRQLVIEPSGSLLASLKLHCRLVQLAENSAVGGWLGAVQVIAKFAWAVPPDGTLTDLELPPLTEQFPGTPLRLTVWLPAASPVNVTLPLASIV